MWRSETAVKMGRGSVRDALTSLETVVSTGIETTSFGSRLLEALGDRSLVKVLNVVAEANAESVDFKDFSEQTFEDLRDLYLIANGCDPKVVGSVPVNDEKKVIRGVLGSSGIIVLLEEIGEAINKMTLGADARILFEVALVNSFIRLKNIIKAKQGK